MLAGIYVGLAENEGCPDTHNHGWFDNLDQWQNRAVLNDQQDVHGRMRMEMGFRIARMCALKTQTMTRLEIPTAWLKTQYGFTDWVDNCPRVPGQLRAARRKRARDGDQNCDGIQDGATWLPIHSRTNYWRFRLWMPVVMWNNFIQSASTIFWVTTNYHLHLPPGCKWAHIISSVLHFQ